MLNVSCRQVLVYEIAFRACRESGRLLAADLKSALVGDNPDQHKEREPASDLKHELAAAFHERSGCCFVFSALTLGSISGFGVRSVSISENATKRPRRRRSRRIRRISLLRMCYRAPCPAVLESDL